jgi:hypothetical protein
MIQNQIEHWLPDVNDLDPALTIRIRNDFEKILEDIKISQEDLYASAARKLGVGDNLLDYLQKEKSYRGALAEYKNYQTWLTTRNPKRAAMESKYFYDTKHGSHLVRLFFFAKEILETGNLTVNRKNIDADLLLSIKNGAWTYDQIDQFSKDMEKELNVLYKKSVLPNEPDRDFANDLCISIVKEWFGYE